MNDTNLIVTEGKKISDLPTALSFTDKAAVLVIDSGKTVQMSLVALVQEITKATTENAETLKKRVLELEQDAAIQKHNFTNFKKETNDFKLGVSKRFTEEHKGLVGIAEQLETVENGLNSIRYSENVYDQSTLQMPWYTFSTHHAVVGEVFVPVVNPAGEGYYACCQPVEKGWVFSLEGCQEILPLIDSKYFVVTNMDGIALSTIPIHDLLEEGYEYEFEEDGSFYLSTQYNVNQPDVPLYKIKIPAVGVPKASADDEGKILQVVNGNWKAVDSATAAVGNEVTY